MSNTSVRANAEYRRSQLPRLYFEDGLTQSEIADRFGIDQGQVSRDLKILKERWSAGGMRDYSELRTDHLSELDHLISEAWSNYRIFLKDSCLRTILLCLQERAKLLNLHPAQALDISWKTSLPDGETIESVRSQFKMMMKRELSPADEMIIDHEREKPVPKNYSGPDAAAIEVDEDKEAIEGELWR